MSKKISHKLFNVKNHDTNLFEGLPAVRGESAYDIAKRLGTFTGTEEEWNNALAKERVEAINAIRDQGEETLNSIPDDYIELDGKVNQLSSDVSEVLNTVVSGEKNYYRNMTQGYISNSGSVNENTSSISYQYTDYIPVNEGDYVTVSYINQNGTQTMSANRLVYVAIYDENKISAGNSGGKTDTNYYVVPAGVSFVRVTVPNENGSSIQGYQIEITTDGKFTTLEEYSEEKTFNTDLVSEYVEGRVKEVDDKIRKTVNVYLTDSEEEIYLKMYDAYTIGNCDVYFETGTYEFTTIFELLKTKYGRNTAYELPIGENCRYFFQGSTLIATASSTDTNVLGNESLLGSWRKSGSYELHDAKLISNGMIYIVHDEASGSAEPYVRKYHNISMIANVANVEGYDSYNLRKCIGGGTGLAGTVIIEGCIFTSDYGIEVSFHGHSLEDVSEFRLNITNSYFAHTIGLHSLAVNETGVVVFSGNSATSIPASTSDGWTVYAFCNDTHE